MAYAATVTVTQYQFAGRNACKLVIVETGHSTGNEGWTATVAANGIPALARITMHQCILTAGDGAATTVDPELGETSGTKLVYENGAAGATTNNRAPATVYALPSGTLYGYSKPNGNTGTTGIVTTTLTLLEGHAV